MKLKKAIVLMLLSCLVIACRKEAALDEKSDSFFRPRTVSFNPMQHSNLTFENSVLLNAQGNYNGYIFLFEDLNGDGYGDLIAVSPSSGRAVVWKGEGSSGLNIGLNIEVWMENQGNYTGYDFMVADMTGDGKADLVAVSAQYGRAVVWQSNGSGFNIPSGNPAWMENQGNYTGYNFMVSDLTGDGKADLLAASPQHGRAVVWESNGHELSTSGNLAWMENQGDYTGYDFMVTDVTGDGKSDLVAVVPQYGRAVVWQSNGSGFNIPSGNPTWMEFQGNYTGYKFFVGEMTGDGRSDLIAVSAQDGRAVVWQSTGSSFSASSGNPAWMENQGNFSAYTFGVMINGRDFSNNKKCDLFAVNSVNAQTVSWSFKNMPWPATIQRISGSAWNNDNAQMPYLVYVPERNKLVMQAATFSDIVGGVLVNHRSVLINSTDYGHTWSSRIDFPIMASSTGLTNGGNNTLYCFGDNIYSGFYKSLDDGLTWQATSNTTPSIGTNLYSWDPTLVLNQNGVQKILQIGYIGNGTFGTSAYFSQPYLRTSLDDGNSWTTPEKIDAFKGFNEVNLIVAGNGDLVAACRRDADIKFLPGHADELDNYSGLSISISKNNGQTWSIPKTLFEFGRHHPSMLLLNDGHTLLMTYAVRVGGALGASDNFADALNGYPSYGIEAVLSSDNGVTWDVKNRYILSKWKGNIPFNQAYFFFRSAQSTSTVQLADGTLLTAYGTGKYRTGNTGQNDWFMDIDLLRWSR